MSVAESRTGENVERPATVRTAVVLLGFLGVTAIGGGLAMISGLEGVTPPDEWLDRLPLITNWVVPGMILMVGFGIGSLITLAGILRRPRWRVLSWIETSTGHHWSWLATIAIGFGQAMWIAIELVSIPFSPLMAIYGPLGLALFGLSLTASMRRHLGRGVDV
jgi:hypothetical protein